MDKLYLYLDQRDLINLAEGRDDALKVRLYQEISSGHVQIVLSLMHVIETWKYADTKAKQNLAVYADSLAPIWLLFRSALFYEEILRAFYLFRGEEVVTLIDADYQQVDDSYPPSVGKHRIFSPFRKSALETLSPTSVASDPESYNNSFAQLLTVFEEDPRIVKIVTKVHDSYPDWSILVKTKIVGEIPGKSKWLLGIVQSALGLLSVEKAKVEDFVHSLDIKTCPAICVYLRIKDAINKDNAPTPYPSEMVDIVHVSTIPYCDAFSTDKRIWDYIRRCKINKQMFPKGYARLATAFKSLAGAMISIHERRTIANS
jgi:hypothetical protein